MAEVKLNKEDSQNLMAENADYSDTLGKKLKIFWRRFSKNKIAVICLFVLVALYVISFAAPLIAPYDPAGTADDIFLADMKPSFTSYQSDLTGTMQTYKPNFFGRDELGRDVFSRCVYAGQISLTVGFVSVFIFISIGTVWGCLAGYYGGVIDNVMMRVVDALMSIPTMPLLITVMALFKPSIYNVMIVLGLTGWTGIARMVRGEFLSLMKRDYVEAARSVGCKDRRIIFTHVLPNAVAPIIVAATMGMAGAILSESGLSFFGLGVQPPTASWGNMLMNAQDLSTMVEAPWKAFYPGMLIFITVLAFNFVGDALRDALDPRLKQ